MRGRAWWVGMLLAASLPVAADDGRLPPYVCHPAKEGRGRAFDPAFAQRLVAARTLPTTDAIAELEALRATTRRHSYAEGALHYELAWRYVEASRPAQARDSIVSVLANDYIEGKRVDLMRALLAQLAADGDDWPAVIDLLEPLAQATCRPLPPQPRYLLARAYGKLQRFEAALDQIDLAAPEDDATGLAWMRIALAIECDGADAAACARRVLRYAGVEAPSAELQTLLNDRLATLNDAPAARPLLDEARAAGRIDDAHHIVPQSRAELEDLEPLKRVAPTYPLDALRRGQSGYVTLEVTVGADGSVTAVHVADSAPPGVFDGAALKAARAARFKARVVDGQPVESRGRYTVRFVIDR